MFGFKKKNKKTESEVSEPDGLVVETMSSALRKKGAFSPFKAKQKGGGLFSFSSRKDDSSAEKELPKKEEGEEEEVTTKLVNSSFSFGDEDLITSITPKKEPVEIIGIPEKEKGGSSTPLQNQEKVVTLNSKTDQKVVGLETKKIVDTKKEELPIKKPEVSAPSNAPLANNKVTTPEFSASKINKEDENKKIFVKTTIKKDVVDKKEKVKSDEIETTLKRIEKLEHLSTPSKNDQRTEDLPSNKSSVVDNKKESSPSKPPTSKVASKNIPVIQAKKTETKGSLLPVKTTQSKTEFKEKNTNDQKTKTEEFLGKLKVEKISPEDENHLVKRQELKIKPSFIKNVPALDKTIKTTEAVISDKKETDWAKALGIDLDVSIPEELEKTPALPGLFNKVKPFFKKQPSQQLTEKENTQKTTVTSKLENEHPKKSIIAREEALEFISKQKKERRPKAPVKETLPREEGPAISRQAPFSRLYSNSTKKETQQKPEQHKITTEKEIASESILISKNTEPDLLEKKRRDNIFKKLFSKKSTKEVPGKIKLETSAISKIQKERELPALPKLNQKTKTPETAHEKQRESFSKIDLTKKITEAYAKKDATSNVVAEKNQSPLPAFKKQAKIDAPQQKIDSNGKFSKSIQGSTIPTLSKVSSVDTKQGIAKKEESLAKFSIGASQILKPEIAAAKPEKSYVNQKENSQQFTTKPELKQTAKATTPHETRLFEAKKEKDDDMKSSIQRIHELNPSYKEDNVELKPFTHPGLGASFFSSFHKKNKGGVKNDSFKKVAISSRSNKIEGIPAVKKSSLENSPGKRIPTQETEEAQKHTKEPEEKDIEEITSRLKKLTEPERPERIALLKKLLNKSTEKTKIPSVDNNLIEKDTLNPALALKTGQSLSAKTIAPQQRNVKIIVEKELTTKSNLPQKKQPQSTHQTNRTENISAPLKNTEKTLPSVPPTLASVIANQENNKKRPENSEIQTNTIKEKKGENEKNSAIEDTLKKISHLEKTLKNEHDLEATVSTTSPVKKITEKSSTEQPKQEVSNQNLSGPFFEKNEEPTKRESSRPKDKDDQISSLSTRLDKYKHTVDERKRIRKIREQSREEKIKAIIVEPENKINMPLLAIAIVVMILTAGSGYYYYKYTIKKEPIKNLPFIPDVEIESPLSDIMPQQPERITGPNTTLEGAETEQFNSENLQESIKSYIASVKENPRMAVELRNGYFVEPHDQNNSKLTTAKILDSFGIDLGEAMPLLEDNIYFFIIRNQKKQPSDPVIVKLNLLIKAKSASMEDELVKEIKSLESALPTELLPLFIDENKPSVPSTVEFKSLFTKSRASSEIRYFNYVPKNSTQAIEWGIVKINGLRYLAISTSKRSTDVMILNFE